jgi:hypothetical protein
MRINEREKKLLERGRGIERGSVRGRVTKDRKEKGKRNQKIKVKI